MRVNLADCAVVARLRNCKPKGRLAPGIICVWLLIGALTMIKDGIEPGGDQVLGWL